MRPPKIEPSERNAKIKKGSNFKLRRSIVDNSVNPGMKINVERKEPKKVAAKPYSDRKGTRKSRIILKIDETLYIKICNKRILERFKKIFKYF
jgi:hypothetical protein